MHTARADLQLPWSHPSVSPWQSTGYVVNFLVRYRAFVRLTLLPVLVCVLIPLSKVARTLAVRLMYWFAFRGINVEKAKRVAD